MSTRCNVIIEDGTKEVILYHHHGGYPEGVGKDLTDILSTHSFADADALSAHLQKVDRYKDDGYGIHGDIEYLYTIDLSARTLVYQECKPFSDWRGKKNKLLEYKDSPESKTDLPPIYKQYIALKAKHPDALLLFRTSDFYMTYQDDAEAAAKTLGITLTKSTRQKDENGNPLKMAGFPYHNLDNYLPKLIHAGHRVAICDEFEDLNKTKQPKGAKAPSSTTTDNQKEKEQEMTKIIIAATKDCTEMADIAAAVQNSIWAASPAILATSDRQDIELVNMADEYPSLTRTANGEDNPDPQVFASWQEQTEVKMVCVPSFLAVAAQKAAEDEGFSTIMQKALAAGTMTLSNSSVLIRVMNEDDTWFEYAIAVTQFA